MSILKVDTQPLVPKRQAFPPGAGSAAEAVTKQGGPASAELASFIRNVDAWLNKIQAILQISPTIDKIAVVDKSGKVIAALGDFIFAGVPATNYFSEIHVGDPLNTGDPSQALFNANTDGTVTVGQNGSLDVLDPFGADAAWIGTQSDVFDITGAAAGAASGTVNLIRLTVVGHTLLTGDQAKVLGVVGVTTATDGTSNANGAWTVTKIDADHVDLQDSVFVGSYVSGGTISRILHVTGAVDNGTGMIRLTVTAHGYETGDKVDVLAVGGVPNAIGQWIITVIDADHFDLDGSTFAGAYTSGGIVLRYFAGGLFGTIAIGPSFTDYRLRAFADGTLRIRNAEIILVGAGGSIVLDPSVPSIVLTGANGVITLDGSDPSINVTSSSTSEVSSIDPVNGFMQTDGTLTFQAISGVVTVSSASFLSRVGQGTVNVGDGTNIHARIDADSGSGGGSAGVYSTAGAHKATLEVIGGNGALCINGFTTQVVGPRLPAVTAPTINTTTITATAGATYTATEQGMLASLKAAVNQLNADVASLATAVNDIRARLAVGTGHGLTS